MDEEKPKKKGRPAIKTRETLIEAAVRIGYPASTGELGEAMELNPKTVTNRIRKGGWLRVGEKTRVRFYPEGYTPYLLTTEEAAVINRMRANATPTTAP